MNFGKRISLVVEFDALVLVKHVLELVAVVSEIFVSIVVLLVIFGKLDESFAGLDIILVCLT